MNDIGGRQSRDECDSSLPFILRFVPTGLINLQPMDRNPPSAETIAFWQGVAQFNQGELYACHDTWEAIWTEAMEPDRSFYQGLIQIAVGFYHLGNHNWRGAAILVGQGSGRLREYRPDYAGLEIADFYDQIQAILTDLQARGPEQVAALATELGLGPRPDPVRVCALPKLCAIDAASMG
jgi:uncharacterized protein